MYVEQARSMLHVICVCRSVKCVCMSVTYVRHMACIHGCAWDIAPRLVMHLTYVCRPRGMCARVSDVGM